MPIKSRFRIMTANPILMLKKNIIPVKIRMNIPLELADALNWRNTKPNEQKQVKSM